MERSINDTEKMFYARALYKLTNSAQDAKKFNELTEQEQEQFRIVSLSFVQIIVDRLEYNNLKDKFEKIEQVI